MNRDALAAAMTAAQASVGGYTRELQRLQNPLLGKPAENAQQPIYRDTPPQL